VLVIHGRGLHSGEAGPVLRDRVTRVLSAGPTSAHVRAFCSASGRDGGVGAMYVLVKQSP
jgi:DNA-nicking Smr family endonuclease